MSERYRVVLLPSWRQNKKYAVLFLHKEEHNLNDASLDILILKTILQKGRGHYIIHFGDSRYEDFTTHKSDIRKKLYILRHQREDWTDVTRASYWARFLLWSKPTIEEAIKDIESRDAVKIIDRR